MFCCLCVLCVRGMFFDSRVQSLASENQSPKALISSQASISGNFLHKQLSAKFKASSVPQCGRFFSFWREVVIVVWSQKRGRFFLEGGPSSYLYGFGC